MGDRMPPPRFLVPPLVIHIEPSSSEWKEYEHDKDGTPFYYNVKSKETRWEKPTELMDPVERADALTGWKELCTRDTGAWYYFNRVTKDSVWDMPDEIKVARNLVVKASKFYQICKDGLNIYNENLELGDEDDEDSGNQETKFLCNSLLQLLCGKVYKVKASKLLRTPCVLRSAKIRATSSMPRVAKSLMRVTKIRKGELMLGINPDHPIIIKLNVLLKSRSDSAEAKMLADFLYEVALICSGFVPETPAGLYDMIYRILETSLAARRGKADAKKAAGETSKAADLVVAMMVIESSEANPDGDPLEGLMSLVLAILKLI